jgi:hypothetical protein
MIKRCLLLLAIVLLPAIGRAAEQASSPGPASWAGPGITSCADFTKACHDDPETMENLFYSWALGFMSGLNVGLAGHGDTNLHQWSEQAQKDFLKTTCAAHPRGGYVGAVFDLYNRMRKDQGLPNYFRGPSGSSKTK